MSIYSENFVVDFGDGTEALISEHTLSGDIITEDLVVRDGDSLFSIANKLFKDTSQWYLIALLNPTIDPLSLSIGSVIKIPHYE